ncbi:MAG: murein biosynthesis integral membrane protein MurJ [Gammaproteobacteria bacterium]|nr:MAG: murein biosynthesis integral membrane protein MurJ [Gammaproteobacteria bacterium]
MSLLKSGFWVSIMTLISRISGFIRDMVFANLFGATAVTDVFFIAFKIPNFFRRLFAEGAFSLAFVPVFTEYKETKTHNELKDFAAYVAGTLGVILLVLTLIVVLASPVLVYVFAAGFIGDDAKLNLTADMLQITFSYLFFISMTAYSAGILNSFNHFVVPAFTPVLLNLCLITAALLSALNLTSPPIMLLAWGVFVAGLVQFLFQIPFLLKLKLLTRPKWGWKNKGVKKIIKLMIPALFGSSVAQINLLFDTFLASFLISGSISWLYYSDRLVELPLGLFGVALAVVILPSLSAKFVKDKKQEFSDILDWALKIALLIAIPATIGLFLLGKTILWTLFAYNAFTPEDVNMASMSLQAYALGLPAFILIKVLAPGFYARFDMKTPVKIGIKVMFLNMVLNILFLYILITYNLAPAHIGLAAATSMAAWIHCIWLFVALKNKIYHPNKKHWFWLLSKIFISSAGMALVILMFDIRDELWQNYDVMDRVINMSMIIMSAIIIYVVLSYGLGVRNLKYKTK